MSRGVFEFCIRESRGALIGTILGVDKPIMSPPTAIWAAEHKIFQLAVAKSVGLVVPDTVVTNKPHEVREAFARLDRKMIAKVVRSGFVEAEAADYAIYTSQVFEEHLAEIEDTRWSPAIYQRLLPKKCDVRVTDVGDRLFAAEIDSQNDPAAMVDWRKTSNPLLPHKRASLPTQLEEKLHQMLSRLGLTFAAIDLIRTPSARCTPIAQRIPYQFLLQDR